MHNKKEVRFKKQIDYLNQLYVSIQRPGTFKKVLNIYNNSAAMSEVNSVLDELNKLGKLNNNNIPRMVKNYFLELCFVTFEISDEIFVESQF